MARHHASMRRCVDGNQSAPQDLLSFFISCCHYIVCTVFAYALDFMQTYIHACRIHTSRYIYLVVLSYIYSCCINNPLSVHILASLVVAWIQQVCRMHKIIFLCILSAGYDIRAL